MKLFAKLRRWMSSPEQYRISGLTFLSEQDGEIERELKEGVIALLKARSDIARAYLVRVGIPDSADDDNVALVLVGPASYTLTEKIGKEFRRCGIKGHLDIMFIDPAREKDVAAVARPFFTRRAD